MKSRVIQQAVTKDCLFNVLADWCKNGAGKKNRTLRILSAFASGIGVAALSPLFDIFLSQGNELNIICGIDRNGTDADAIRRLYGLLSTHRSDLHVSIFHAPSRYAIFHPKLYINERPTTIDFVIGSANMTSCGLGSNFESLLLYENVPRSSAEAKHALSIWETFSNPVHPLRKHYLKQLTQTEKDKLIKRLPKKSPREKTSMKRGVAELWRPLSHVSLPRSERVHHRTPCRVSQIKDRYLLMDVLTETRSTQMQIPLHVVEAFFGIKRHQRADISVAMLGEDGLTQPIKRPIVISEGPDKSRLMRRLEMPDIRSLSRNLAVAFVKLEGRRRFAYRILPKGSKAFRTASILLENSGQQGHGIRRYLIGSKGDSHWLKFKSLLPL